MTTTNQAPGPRYLSCADTAKLIRAALKPAFPGIKFSVRSSTYSGGASIRVSWVDGPTGRQVEAVTGGFAGARFDGMIDLKTGASSWYCPTHTARTAETYGHSYASENGPVCSRCCHRAELVHMGADYVFAERSYSAAARAMLEGMAARREGRDTFDGNEHVNGEYMSTWFYRLAQGTPLGVDSDGSPVVVAVTSMGGTPAAVIPPAGAPVAGDPGTPAWLAAQEARVAALTARFDRNDLDGDAWDRLHRILNAARAELTRWTA